MHRNSSTVSTKQQRLAKLAKQSPQMGFTSLAHLMDIDWLEEAYRRTRKDAAAGVDGMTAERYEANLKSNLEELLDRVKGDTYRAPPVRRVYIPKGNSATESRPIGIPTLKDKVVQRAVAMVLEPIYEQDFYDCSFGFRPGRSAHQALESLWKQAMDSHGGWILEVDIRKFFDTLDHAHLRRLIGHRVRDGVLTRLIGKWLKAGVLEAGAVTYPDAGSPQGGVISPVLSNIFLHYVLDQWVEQVVKPRLRGKAFLIRYADDFVMGFTHAKDARRVLAVLPQRLAKYSLAIHPEKTRLIAFHKTASSRLSRALQSIALWCRANRHRPVKEQQHMLSLKLRGHFAYYGITGNFRSLAWFRFEVVHRWRKWLNRRNRERSLDWNIFNRLLERYPLPSARVVHSVYHRAASP